MTPKPTAHAAKPKPCVTAPSASASTAHCVCIHADGFGACTCVDGCCITCVGVARGGVSRGRYTCTRAYA